MVNISKKLLWLTPFIILLLSALLITTALILANAIDFDRSLIPQLVTVAIASALAILVITTVVLFIVVTRTRSSEEMNEELAKKVLGTTIQPDGKLYNKIRFTQWEPGEETVLLEGSFKTEILLAMYWWMQNKSKKTIRHS